MVIINNTIKIVVFVLLSLNTVHVMGQVLISQLPPNPVRFSGDDVWNISVINNGEEQSVYLKGTLSDQNGAVLINKQSTPILIKKGVNSLSGTNVATLSSNVNANHPTAKIISEFNNLPYGRYNLCVNLYSVETQELLAESCLEHESQPVTPPTLLNPDYCSEVNTKLPVFTWLAPAPQIRGQQVYYDFKLTEVFEGQSHDDAIQRNLAIVFANNLTQTNFLYPSNSQALDSNKKYVWQVQAKIKKYNSVEVPDKVNPFKHIGISEVWCLNYKQPDLPEIEVEKKTITYAIPKVFEDAAITATNILYISFKEDLIAGNLDYKILDSEGKTVDLSLPFKVKKGDNRYDINLKQTTLFKDNELYKMIIKSANGDTYYLNFKYKEE